MSPLWIGRAVGAAVLVLALTGCATEAGATGGASPSRLRVPTDAHIAGPDGDMAGLQGRLASSRTGGRACFWIDGPNGRAFIVTRSGSYATADLELVESGAKVTAKAGQTYLFSGAPGPTTTIAGCPGSGRPWYTGDISAPDASYSQATLPPERKTS